jgi:hypothetical protein
MPNPYYNPNLGIRYANALIQALKESLIGTIDDLFELLAMMQPDGTYGDELHEQKEITEKEALEIKLAVAKSGYDDQKLNELLNSLNSNNKLAIEQLRELAETVSSHRPQSPRPSP